MRISGNVPKAQVCNRNLCILFARHVLYAGGLITLRAFVRGTSRLGKGVRREAESEGS